MKEVVGMTANQKTIIGDIDRLAMSLGANHTALIEVSAIRFDTMFRKVCESKTCGAYGSNYMCPPYVGNIENLMEIAKSYDMAFVFQTITALEDSFDVEGMYGAGKRNNDLAKKKKKDKLISELGDVLILGSGACGFCDVCALKSGVPCPFEESAIASIEAYGIDASSLAKAGQLNYINGQNTVTYYGLILFKEN